MVGEFLSKENLIVYKEEKILMHSLVDNDTGNISGDPADVISKLGFRAVPSRSGGTFILEEEALEKKIN